MFKIIAIVLFLVVAAKSQLSRDDSGNPTRYVLPYSGLAAEDQQEAFKDDQYYKPNRRAERIPATAYQYDEEIAEQEYYRPQQKEEHENYRYQSTPSHKDYEQILKHNHLARLRVAAKKQREPQRQPQREHDREPQAQPAVEQYLKEVNPTTKTAYQRPSNYLRFSGQSAELKQEQSEETVKQQPYRYVLQPELQQQKAFSQYQYETQDQSIKGQSQSKVSPPFNLAAYQNALIAQQKVETSDVQEDSTPKSSIYVSQNIAKKPTIKKSKTRPAVTQQYDYYPQVAPQPQPQSQRPAYLSETTVERYQQPITRNLYQKSEAAYQAEEPLLYPEPKELEYQTPAPVRAAPKQRTTTRIPKRKPTYQTEEPSEDYQQEQAFEYQAGAFKYQEEQPLAYRRPTTRPTPKSLKYAQAPLEETSDVTEIPQDGFLQYQVPLAKYQQEAAVPRRAQQLQYQREPEARQQIPSRYLTRQQYPEESRQLPQYEQADLAYQPTSDIPVRYSGRGPSVSYRQELPNSSVRYYRNLEAPISYVESEQVTPRKPTPFNIVAYEKALKEQQKLLEAERRLLEKEVEVTSTTTRPKTTRRTTKKPKYQPQPDLLQIDDYPDEAPLPYQRPLSKPKYTPVPNIFHRRQFSAFHQRDLTSQGSSNIPVIYHDGSLASAKLAHHRNVRAVIIVVD